MGRLLEGFCPRCRTGRIVPHGKSGRMVCSECGETFSPRLG